MRRIAISSFGKALLSTPRVATYEAATLSKHAQPSIVEIKDRRTSRDNLDRFSHLLQRPARVALTAADEQILSLP